MTHQPKKARVSHDDCMADLPDDPPLVAAIRRGDTRNALQRIQQCIAADDLQQLEKSDGNGAGPLTVACEKGHTEICHVLLAAGAAMGARTYGGFTPLLVACEMGHVEAVRLLLAEVSAAETAGASMGRLPSVDSISGANNATSGESSTSTDASSPSLDALADTLRWKSSVSEFIAGGFNVVWCNSWTLFSAQAEATPASVEGPDADMQRVRGGSACPKPHGHSRMPLDIIDAATDDGATPLLVACSNGNREIARLLLDAGASVNVATTGDGVSGGGGTTPLHVACRNGDREMAHMLLSAGAQKDAAKANGATALFIAVWKNHLDVVNLLLTADVQVDLAKTTGATPLFIASWKGHVDVASLLVDAGASTNAETDDGVTPLLIACRNGHVEIARLLLASGAEVDAAANDGSTALLLACAEGHLEATRVLLGAGAPVDAATDGGYTPMLVACHQGHLSIVQLLSLHGADREPLDGERTAESVAASSGAPSAAVVVAWLQHSRDWSSPLHHLELLTGPQARALLRGGARLGARARSDAPSPIEMARSLMQKPPGTPGRDAAKLVVSAAEPWSPMTHQLWPAAARERASSLVREGLGLADISMWLGLYSPEASAVMDTWREVLVPASMTRDEFEVDTAAAHAAAAADPSS